MDVQNRSAEALQVGDVEAADAARMEFQLASERAAAVLDGDMERIRDVNKNLPEPRGKAEKWLTCFDNQVYQIFGEHFCERYAFDFHDTKTKDVDATTMPRCSISIDQGSDGIAGVYFAASSRGLGCTIDHAFDLSHGIWRDCLLTLKEQKCFQDIYMWMMALNTNFKGFDQWFAVQRESLSLTTKPTPI